MSTTKPNILFLLTDDQRFDTVAALGNTQVHTPNLDALIACGTAFTQAHIMGGSSGAVCMPSRAMLHTGRSLWRIHREGQSIDPGHALMCEHFRNHGYETFGAGKWHNSPQSYARCFDAGGEILFGGMADHWNMPAYDFDPTGEYAEVHPVCSGAFFSNNTMNVHYNHITPGAHSTDLLTDCTCDFLRNRARADEPFFAYLAYLSPHDPRTMPARFLNMYDPDEIELPPNFMSLHSFDHGIDYSLRDEALEAHPRTPQAVRKHIAEYYAMISHVDARVGELIETLKETGQYENTILVFAGDNGLAVGQHGLMGKQNLYDHSIRVPMVLAGPGVPEGETRDAYTYLIDLFPTLCDLASLSIPETVEGQSLQPVLASAEAPHREVLLFAYTELHRAAKDGRYRLIECITPSADEPSTRYTQLFDLQNDPWELCNLAGESSLAGVKASLGAELRRWQTELDDTREAFGQIFWRGIDTLDSIYP